MADEGQTPEEGQGVERKSKTGGWWDWPVGVIIGAVLLALVTGGGGGSRLFVFLLFWFGVISLLIRRGAFTPRR